MFSWGIIALIVAVIAGVLGFTGIAGAASMVAYIVFGIGLVLFVVALLVGKAVTK